MPIYCPFHLLRRLLPACFLTLMVQATGWGQDTLPHIGVMESAGANRISWISPYKGIHTIGVQLSADSLYNYSTIGYVKEPGLKENGFEDRHFGMGRNFYRLYIEFPEGKLVYSRPTLIIDSPMVAVSISPTASPMAPPAPAGGRTSVPAKKKVIPYAPSLYVYTNQEGNVNISISRSQTDHYSLKFFDTSGVNIFSVPSISQNFLILDKSNFLHSGWFNFELYDNDKLKQKWKLFIPDLKEK